MSSLTTQDLFSVLKDFKNNDEEKDVTQYRYVIYARKSSESEERQIRSLGDQVIECEKLVENKGLTLLKKPFSSIEEKQSAKEPDVRTLPPERWRSLATWILVRFFSALDSSNHF